MSAFSHVTCYLCLRQELDHSRGCPKHPDNKAMWLALTKESRPPVIDDVPETKKSVLEHGTPEWLILRGLYSLG